MSFSVVVLTFFVFTFMPNLNLGCIEIDISKADLFSKISLSSFLISIQVAIMRQYTNAKRLYIETNNRLIVSKLLANIKQNEEDSKIKESAYPELINAIVHSPYNKTQPSEKEGILLKDIISLLKKSS